MPWTWSFPDIYSTFLSALSLIFLILPTTPQFAKEAIEAEPLTTSQLNSYGISPSVLVYSLILSPRVTPSLHNLLLASLILVEVCPFARIQLGLITLPVGSYIPSNVLGGRIQDISLPDHPLPPGPVKRVRLYEIKINKLKIVIMKMCCGAMG
ncbi:unnamed protein product [Protopolystoma xenopodis]|uniref:Uncharacterized protein n=1 Tax=Protopolystoma xenopodis TaxID=117903 RepID=A0A448WQP5_9PLAT|nr:unnamed protein product [Protopolystoma xenopodis]